MRFKIMKDRFEYTPEGLEEAKRWLKGMNLWKREVVLCGFLMFDGIGIIHKANELYNKELNTLNRTELSNV